MAKATPPAMLDNHGHKRQNMKKTISFGHNTVVLERSKSAASITVTPIPENTPLPMQIAELADRINESEIVDVFHILPSRGKINFMVERNTTNAIVIDIVCDAIECVYDTSTIISNERAQSPI